MSSFLIKLFKFMLALLVIIIVVRAVLVMSGTGSISKTVIKKDSIAVIDIDGGIFGSSEIIEQLKELKDNPLVKGIVIRVNSPGGAVTPSMEIYDYILTLGKPVYAAMGTVAASGGYLISLAADTIYAEPSTITGSIGVIMNLVNTQELMDKIGIKSVVLKSGAYKDSGSSSREMTEGDKKVLNAVLMDMYNQFVDIVSKRRGLKRDEVLKLADGRIYTGRMAEKVNLVNELGSWRTAAENMKKNKFNNAPLDIVEIPRKKTFLEELASSALPFDMKSSFGMKDSQFLYYAEIH